MCTTGGKYAKKGTDNKEILREMHPNQYHTLSANQRTFSCSQNVVQKQIYQFPTPQNRPQHQQHTTTESRFSGKKEGLSVQRGPFVFKWFGSVRASDGGFERDDGEWEIDESHTAMLRVPQRWSIEALATRRAFHSHSPRNPERLLPWRSLVPPTCQCLQTIF